MTEKSYYRVLMSIFLLSFIIALPAMATQLFVSVDGIGTTCTQENPCSLQTALAQASDNDAIYLAQGTYTGAGDVVITVTKSIFLYGGWDGSTHRPLLRDPEDYPTTVQGEDQRQGISIIGNITPTIDGLIVTSGKAPDGGGIHIDGDPRDNGSSDIVAYEYSAINPWEGTIGTKINISGPGFGTKKGKVLVGNVALKILEWTDESIQCLLSRALMPDTYDVTIQPKGTSPIVLFDSFTVKAPEIDSVEPVIGSTGDHVTIHGFFFGTTKGKVILGNKNCRILRWEMDPGTGESEINFVVPKILGDGTREVKVTNGVGADTAYFTVGTDRATSFQSPMDPYIEVHRYFDEWTDNYGGKYHAAQDCHGEGGDPVYAAANGVVSYSYGEGGEWRGYGYLITIDHQLLDESWYYSLYGHLSTRRWKKEEGKPVYRGELIGYLGDDDEDGSSAWGPHLHFGIRVGKKSDYNDFLVGYYSDHPALHGWMNPGEFIEEH